MASEARYVPIPPDGDIPEDEIGYVEDFAALAATIDSTSSSEDITLLLSTCRNAWMTVNAIFVDLRDVIGASETYDRLSSVLFALGGARPDRRTDERIEEIGLSLHQVADKLSVWERRHALMDQLMDRVAALAGARRSRMRALLARQKEMPPTELIAHGRFLALDLESEPDETVTARELCAQVCDQLLAIFDVAQALRGIATPLAELDGAVEAADALFTDDLQATKTAAVKAAWPAVVVALAKAKEKVAAFADAPDASSVEPETLDLHAAREWLVAIANAGRSATAAARATLRERFTPNVSSAPPMPAPFVIDLSQARPARSHGRAFQIERATGHVTLPPDVPRIALLRCGMPEDAYSHADPDRYVYEPGGFGKEAIAAAQAAIEQAAAQGCQLLALPEVFVPQRAAEALHRQAMAKELILVCGAEYLSTQTGKPINPVQISIPGVFGPITQVKQGPSKFELRAEDFAADSILRVFRNTAVGNLAVIVCSDLLEFDVVATLAAVDERLDLLVVCARNPNVRVFTGLAIADAMRVYAGVAIVNARPDKAATDSEPRKPANSDGTLLALPLSRQPLAEPSTVLELGIDWSGDESPTLAIYDFPLKSIRDRDRNTQDSTYLPPPTYIRRKPN